MQFAPRRAGRRPVLIFVSRRPPLPLANGARIRTHRLVTGLSDAFETTLLTFDHHRSSGDGNCDLDELAAVLPGVDVVTVPGCGPGRRLPQLASVPRRSSWLCGRYDIAAFRAELHRLVSERHADIVHFDDLGAAMHGPIEKVFNVYSAPDIEQTIVAHMAASTRGSRQAFARIEYPKVRREELRAWRSMDLCLATSPDDAEAMRAGGARHVDICPNGTDPVDPLPLAALPPGDPLQVLFVGSGGYQPYQRGLAWFVREVMPRLAPSELLLDIVGSPPRDRLVAPQVSYRGIVPDVAPWYAQAHVVIVPVFEGSGTRLKMVEAAAFGRPMISTPLGAQGLPLVADRHYACRSDAAGFVEALTTLRTAYESSSAALAAQLIDARAAITDLFWPRIGQQLSERYLGELAGRSA